MRPWEERAACQQVDPALFTGPYVGEAQRICRECPVRPECLATALAESPQHDAGVWGGFTVEERRRLRRLLAANAETRRPTPFRRRRQ